MTDKFGYLNLGYDTLNARDQKIFVGSQGGTSNSLSVWVNNPELLEIENYTYIDFPTRLGRGDFGTSMTYEKINGENTDISMGSEEMIVPWGGAFSTGSIMSSPDTFDITYNNALDGLGTLGALTLDVVYLDSSYNYITASHTLGNTGLDTTSFSGYGINKATVSSTGGTGWNEADITFSATTDTTDQALIQATEGMNTGALYHIGGDRQVLVDNISINTDRITGNDPVVLYRVYGYNRTNGCRYLTKKISMDSSSETLVDLEENVPLIFGEKEVIFITGESNKNSTVSRVSFSMRDIFKV